MTPDFVKGLFKLNLRASACRRPLWAWVMRVGPGRLEWLGGWEAGWSAVKGESVPFGTPIYTFRA